MSSSFRRNLESMLKSLSCKSEEAYDVAEAFDVAEFKTALNMISKRIKALNQIEKAKTDEDEFNDMIDQDRQKLAIKWVDDVICHRYRVAAYEYLKLYCETVIQDLTLMESCRISQARLRESLAGLIYASKHLSHTIPEFKKIRMHVKSKYGKSFVLAADAGHPDSGINALFVKKLSPNILDDSIKIRVLIFIDVNQESDEVPQSLDIQKKITCPSDSSSSDHPSVQYACNATGKVIEKKDGKD